MSGIQAIFQAANPLGYNPCRGGAGTAGVQEMYKHSCGVHIPITILMVSKSFDMLFMEDLHSLTQAIIHIWVETICLNVYRAMQRG